MIAFSLLAGLGGCGGGASGTNHETGTAPTVSGTVGGAITPIPPATPPATPPAAQPGTGGRPPGKAVLTPAVLVPTVRFIEQMPAEQFVGPTYSPEGGEYDLGSVVVSTADVSPAVFLTRIHGWIRYPGAPVNPSGTAPTSYPVVIFLHGMHNRSEPSFEGYDYLANDLVVHGYVTLSIDANDINAFCPSTAIGCIHGGAGDYSSQSRGQLVLATLDRLKKLSDGGQTTTGIQIPKQLIGKIDFSRIGIMGHSRGGQGINDAIQLNDRRIGVSLQQLRSATAELQNEKDNWAGNTWFAAPGAAVTTGTKAAFLTTLNTLIAELSVNGLSDQDLSTFLDMNNVMLSPEAGDWSNTPPKYVFKAALSLAPTDSQSYRKIASVPFAAMVGTCDGDVNNLSGTHVLDNNRFSRDPADSAPRFQIVVRGANHNYFNSQWTKDDYSGLQGDYCYADATHATRLATADQQSIGLFVINSFMRNFVGGEAVFAPYWNGTARLPAAACPGSQAPCDNRVVLTIQINGVNGHKMIAPFDEYGLNQPYDSTISTLQTGGPLDLIDASAFRGNVYTCATDLTLGDGAIPTCTQPSPTGIFFRTGPEGPLSTYVGGLLSIANQVQFTLTGPNMTLPVTLKEPAYGPSGQPVTANALSTVGFDTLSFRIAMVRPQPSVEGMLAAQQVSVTLTDSKGRDSPAILVSDFSDALDSSMGLSIPPQSSMPELLNMVAIPLDAFGPDPASKSTFDITQLSKLTLKFANAPNDGTAVSLTDLELQNFGRNVH